MAQETSILKSGARVFAASKPINIGAFFLVGVSVFIIRDDCVKPGRYAFFCRVLPPPSAKFCFAEKKTIDKAAGAIQIRTYI